MTVPTATAPDPKAAAQVTPEAAPKDPKDQKPATPAAAAPPQAPAGAPAKAVEPVPPKADEKKPDGQPEPVKYDELKLPDGSTLKPEDVEGVKAWAKEQGLSLKQAQAYLDRENGRAQAEREALSVKVAGWQKATSEHPELGGANLVRTTQRTDRALKRFDQGGALTKMLEATGLGNLPEVVGFLERIGAADGNDKYVVPPPAPTEPAKKSDAEVFYASGKKS